MRYAPEALWLADRLESDFIRSQTMVDAAAELRRLHAVNAALLEALKEASDHLAEIYAKYQTKIGPFASQSQRINVKARAAIVKAEGSQT